MQYNVNICTDWHHSKMLTWHLGHYDSFLIRVFTLFYKVGNKGRCGEDKKKSSKTSYFQGCARFAEIASELTKTWSSGATEFGVWIGNCNVKVWKSTEDKLHKIWNSKYFTQISAKRAHPSGDWACHLLSAILMPSWPSSWRVA